MGNDEWLKKFGEDTLRYGKAIAEMIQQLDQVEDNKIYEFSVVFKKNGSEVLINETELIELH
jgi:hypothetical protein